jgi:hypothetical protein
MLARFAIPSGSCAMRSAELRLETYSTDKIRNGYLRFYDPLLAPLVEREVRVLEIGVYEGGSLRLWRDYFPRGRITGIDLRVPPDLEGEERIRAFAGDQSDTAFLTRVAKEAAPEGFDLIVDDASHLAAPTRTAFWHLFDHHLKRGGLYAIEDWGTGYWEDWPDGKAVQGTTPGGHAAGMVALVKELVDEQGAADLSRGRAGAKPKRRSKFESLTVYPPIVFVRKAAADPRPA